MTTMAWRYLADDGVSAAAGLATDEVMTRRQGDGGSPPTVRLYTYAPHCALVGRFQRAASEVRLDYCRQHGIAVNRRPTGGGAILMGADQLGVAITVPERAERRSYDRTRELFRYFGEGLVEALRTLGVAAEYRRKNDIEVRGRKIAGLGIYFDAHGGLLFHASLLVDLDIGLMLSVLATPFEKISDKEIATVEERITTVRRECGNDIPVAGVRSLLRLRIERCLGVELVPGELTAEERADVDRLVGERYGTPAWIASEPAVPDSAGVATRKTPGGLVTAHLTLAGDVIKAVYLTGDFFCDEEVVLGIERALRWHAATPAFVHATLVALGEREGLRLPSVPTEDLTGVIQQGVDAARQREQAGVARGCFVNP